MTFRQAPLRAQMFALVVVAATLVMGYLTAHPSPTVAQAAPVIAEPSHVPCSLRTPGLQYECVDKNGQLQPAGPAAARQTKYFDGCAARGRPRYKCLDEAARVK